MIKERLTKWLYANNLIGTFLDEKRIAVEGSTFQMIRLAQNGSKYGVHWDEESVSKKRYNIFSAWSAPLPASFEYLRIPA